MSFARVANQQHAPRKYASGKRRFSVCWSWSYPWEANRDVTAMHNRFSTMTEARRVGWQLGEGAILGKNVPARRRNTGVFQLSIISFQNVVGEATGQPVAVLQRIDQAGERLPLDERVLADTDTLTVFSLDHLITEQEASPEKIQALRDFLTHEGTCLVLGPHYDVGVSDELKVRALQYAHHSDPLVPRQAKVGPNITPEASSERYAVNAVGFALIAAFPKRKASLGFRYFREFAGRSTFQGYSVQVSGAISF